ncbi:IS1 family transposase [Methylocaldum szegediense]|uniref:Insertion element IS1 protein InsB n=1 Tax=Methylocaldum szegediense TaxID=73780 RepID=A0ABN8X3Q6_9GAMM|nr:insertion element IS1 protein InsB [Methylocaldum szegediense]
MRIAFAPHTRQIVAYALGDRTEATARQLWDRVPAGCREAEVYTDGWEPYAAVIPVNQRQPRRKSAGRTVHVERWNNTLLQRLARYTRKTLGFSQSIQMHEASIRLFLHRYDLHYILLSLITTGFVTSLWFVTSLSSSCL